MVLLAETGPLVERLRQSGIDVQVMPLDPRVRDARKDTMSVGALSRIGSALKILRYAAQVARFAKDHGVDIIHTNSLKADIYGGVAGWIARIPVIWHVRDYIDPSYLPGPAVRVFRRLARIMPTYVIANSEGTRETLRLGKARPSVAIPSGIDVKPRPSEEHSERTHAGDSEFAGATWPGIIRVGIVGRLAPWKGQHVFLHAASRVLKAGYRARFFVIGAPLFGEEAYREELERLTGSLGISDRVEFLGFRSDVEAVLQGLDILVHASTTPEPFGQVVIEGMAQKLPVIGTDGGGVREIISHQENGLLIPMDDIPALADALKTLMDNPSLACRLGHAGFEHVMRHYSSSQTARKIETVYRQVLAGRSGARPEP